MNRHFRLGDIDPLHYFSGIAFILGCVFSFISDEQNFPFWVVFVQWQIQAFATIAFFVLSHQLLFGRLGHLSEWARLIIAGVIASIFFTPFSLLIDVFWLETESYSLPFLIEEWLNMAPPAILCWVMINLPWVMGIEFSSIKKASFDQTEDANKDIQISIVEDTSETQTPELPHVLSLCDLKDVNDIIMLKAELHYLNVVSKQDQHLILYNLKDAIQDVEALLPKAGQWQTHRSYWVNKNKIEKLERKGREGILHFENGSTALVSRAHMTKVKAWFA